MMKAVDQKELLLQLEKSVNNHLQVAIETFQNLSAEALNAPSATGGWSIAQCLEHLNLYGDYYIPAMKDGIARFKGVPARSFKSTWFGNYFINLMTPKENSMKMTAMKAYSPPPNLDAHKIVARFIAQQDGLLDLLNSARTVDLNDIKIPISIFKYLKLKLGDVFGFVIAHNERHVRQALRNV